MFYFRELQEKFVSIFGLDYYTNWNQITEVR